MRARVFATLSLAALSLAAWQARAADPALEIEVHAEAIESPPKEPSVAGSVVRQERLRAPGLQASDVLRTEPGVAVVETGGFGSLSTASVRGATAAQTPIYLAGVRLNDDVGGTADLASVPLFLLNRVEIYRSHAPLAGDQLGLGGAIFFEPKRPQATAAGAGALYGSFATRAAWAHAGLGNRDGAALVGVRVDAAKNDYPFVNDNGTRFDPSDDRSVRLSNADAHSVDAWALANLRLGARGRADLVLNEIDKDQGLPGAALFASNAARATFRRQLGAISMRVPCATAGCESTNSISVLSSHARYDDPLREILLGAPAVDYDATRVDDSLGLRLSLSDALSVAPNLRTSVERLRVDAPGSSSAHARRLASRAALQAEWRASDSLVFRALASAECNGTAFAGRLPGSVAADPSSLASPTLTTCHTFEPAGRAGIEWGSLPLVLLFNIGRYARVPTLAELYGISGAVRGNPTLTPEAGVSAELGIRAAAKASSALAGAAIDAFAFVRDVSGLIAYQRASIGYVRPFNLGSARLSGIELLAEYTPARFVLFALSATLLDPRNTTRSRPANDVLPYHSRLTLAPRLELKHAFPTAHIDAAKLSVTYFYASSRYADPAGLVVIPEQAALDADAELRFRNFSIRGRIANLFNQTRFDLIGYPLPGRNAYLALEAEW